MSAKGIASIRNCSKAFELTCSPAAANCLLRSIPSPRNPISEHEDSEPEDYEQRQSTQARIDRLYGDADCIDPFHVGRVHSDGNRMGPQWLGCHSWRR